MNTDPWSPETPFACVLNSWQDHEGELRNYLLHRLSDPHLTDDFVQEVFLKAMRQGKNFCTLENPRAWLFHVARNTLVDVFRLKKDNVPLPEDLAHVEEEIPPVDKLTDCLTRVLAELPPKDSDIIRQCDLDGVKQQDFANAHGLSLAATKSRLLRARHRMRFQMIRSCQVRFDEAGRVCCHSPLPQN
jgi:RNA polymerase sigma-70 factor, ECF subfamily